MTDYTDAPQSLPELAARLQAIQNGAHAIGVGLSPAQVRASLALNATVLFLSGQPGFTETGALTPLWSLLTALGDLESGKPSPLFDLVPIKRPSLDGTKDQPGGRSPDGTEDQLPMALAATGMDALIRFGSRKKKEAAAEMAALLEAEGYRPNEHRNAASLGKTIAGWRDRLSTGKRTPVFALRAWDMYKKETARVDGMDIDGWLEFIRAHLVDRRNLNKHN